MDSDLLLEEHSGQACSPLSSLLLPQNRPFIHTHSRLASSLNLHKAKASTLAPPVTEEPVPPSSHNRTATGPGSWRARPSKAFAE